MRYKRVTIGIFFIVILCWLMPVAAVAQYPLPQAPTVVEGAGVTQEPEQVQVLPSKITRVQDAALPVTGGDVLGLSVLAALLIVVGTGLSLKSHRLRPRSATASQSPK